MFAVVAIVGLCVWLITQVGMETAEIEIIQFDTWPRTGLAETGSAIEVASVEFKYVHPEELSNTSLHLFFRNPAYSENKNIEVGSRIKFKYRARPMLWLRPYKPDPVAIRSLGLDPKSVEETITIVGQPSGN